MRNAWKYWAFPLVFVAASTGAQTRAELPPANVPIAIQLEQQVQKLTAQNPSGTLWPGFDPLSIPLAVFDGRQTYLFRHPSPPAGFKSVGGSNPKVFVRDGRLEEVTANSSAMIGGVSTATIMQMGSQQNMIPEFVAPVAIHEAFHVFQRAHHKDWIANEADLFIYQFDVPQMLTFRRLESEALRRALMNYDAEKARCWTRTALQFRNERFGKIDPRFSAYERGTELNEGLATYVQARSTDKIVEMPAGEFPGTEVRQRAYASGSAMATLLDRFSPQWKQEFDRGDGKSLDKSLSDAVGVGNICAFTQWETALPAQRSWEEQDLLWKKRSDRVAAFKSKPGWRLVVDWAMGDPLWAQGFDPLNVERLGADTFLHTRFVKLGNANGQIEFMNVESLTEAAGIDPMANGFKQVMATGLQKPVVSDSAGFTKISGSGITAKFRNAIVSVDSTVITVKLLGKR